jgi:YVTN family beta-propeller protein
MYHRLRSPAAPALVSLILSFVFLGGAITPAAALDRTPRRWIAVSPDGKRVYVADPFLPGVTVIDTATLQIVSTIPFRNGGAPGALAMSPDGANSTELIRSTTGWRSSALPRARSLPG